MIRWKNYPRSVLAVLLAIHMLAHIDRNMLLGFSPQITKDLALSNAQYGLLVGAVWVLSYGVMAVFMGTLADRTSRTRVMAVGMLIWSVCTAASGAAQNFEQMVAARFLVATGEAALVPAAVSLLTELFGAERRSTAVGVFFMGIPLGVGFSFLLAGTLGATQGWRGTFYLLGLIGVVIAACLLLFKDRRDAHEASPCGAPFVQQVRSTLDAIRITPAVLWTIIGFAVVNVAFAGLSFVQLWLVRERGFDAAAIARQIGLLQIVFGVLGAAVGGVLGDRVGNRMRGGHANVIVAMILLCSPLMVAYRFAQPGSTLFYIGMCASFFLPLALYGPALAVMHASTAPQMRSTVTGIAMLLVNIFAIAVGSAAVGAISDRLNAAGSSHALTTALLGTDLLVIVSAGVFLLVAAKVRATNPSPAGEHIAPQWQRSQ
ncbi:MFS transporter [Cupriavidus sp. BIS7]|uniref:MFS transporter n=1 Tax=Cupriavidus sp. BIS7 TaxID=1217718 RepID=UPI0002FF5004|nr:MFS transporter [Cupriavidus sp. BIS7]